MLSPPLITTHRYTLLLSHVFLLALALTDATAQMRDWQSHSGKTLAGDLVGTADGRVVIKDASGKSITSRTEHFIESDVDFLKAAFLQDLVANLNPPASTPDWPDYLIIDPTLTKVTHNKTSKGWNRWTSAHWEIYAKREIPDTTISDLTKLLEGTVRSLDLLSTALSPKVGERFQIFLLSDTEELKKEARTTRPGWHYQTRSILCVDEMIGLSDSDGELTLDSAFPNRYLKMCVFDLALHHAGAAAKLPMWLHHGFRRLIGQIPHEGEIIFPGAVMEELRDPEFFAKAVSRIGIVPTLTQNQWERSQPADRGGLSEPMYRHLLGEAAFSICVYFRILDAGAKAKIDEIFTLAASSKRVAPEFFTSLILRGMQPSDPVATFQRVVPQYLEHQWGLLSARSIRRDRVWYKRDGSTFEGELRGVKKGGQLFIKSEKAASQFVEIADLSYADQAYALANVRKSIDYERILTTLGDTPPMSSSFFPPSLAFPSREVTRTVFDKDQSQSGKYIYRSRNFQFTLFGRHPISEQQMEEIGQLFEGTRVLLGRSPFGIQASPVNGYFHAELYDSPSAYRLAGGPPLSGGVYLSSKKKFLVPIEAKRPDPLVSINPAIGEAVMPIEYRKGTLVHEITHMMMHDILQRLPIFIIEGTAEYVEYIPRDNHVFAPQQIMPALRKRVIQYQQKGSGTPEPYHFAKLLKISGDEWHSYIGDSVLRQDSLYFSSFLLVSYFMINEPARISSMLQACRKDAPGLKVYQFELQRYNQAVAEFKKLPSVKVSSNGYTYDAHLRHPDLPLQPLNTANLSESEHLDHLLAGRSPVEVATKVYDWLRNNNIHVR